MFPLVSSVTLVDREDLFCLPKVRRDCSIKKYDRVVLNFFLMFRSSALQSKSLDQQPVFSEMKTLVQGEFLYFVALVNLE